MSRSGSSSLKANTLARAFEQLSKNTELGKMVSKVVIKKKVVRHKKTPIATSESKAKRFRNTIRKTAFLGVGSLRPCSLLTYRPGRPILANGKPGRIKWGLTDGKLEFVVVLYDYPQPLYGTDTTTEYGLVDISKLSRCDCAGYLHGRHCKPKRRTQ